MRWLPIALIACSSRAPRQPPRPPPEAPREVFSAYHVGGLRIEGAPPLARVAEIQRPLLMAYGLRDPRVPPATADRFIRAARAAGVRVWSIAAADEGHWFERAENRRVYEVLLVQFLRSLD